MMNIFAIILSFVVFVNGHILKEYDPSKLIDKLRLTGPNKTQEDVFLRDKEIVKNDNETEAEDNFEKNYFQGDMLLTSEQTALLNHMLDVSSYESAGQTRGLIKDVRKTWKNGIVYYSINQNVGSTKEEIIRKAIRHWEERTCLRFEPRTTEDDYIDFMESDSCASYIGRKGGKQRLLVGDSTRCRLGNIIHEIGHSIGFFHEQARPDRDEYVKIIWKNILQGLGRNFRRFTHSVIDSRDYEYDYDSIMHYGEKAFGKNHRSKQTILPLDPHAHIGQREHLSEYDVLQAEALYNCRQV